MKLPEKNIAVKLLEQYCDAYKKRDLASILQLFTEHCNVWGTAPDEYRVGHADLKTQHERDWGQSEKGEIKIVSIVPNAIDAPWAAIIANAKVTIDGQEYIFEHLRGTVVLAKEEGQWKISHMHCSFPDYRSQTNQSFPEVSR